MGGLHAVLNSLFLARVSLLRFEHRRRHTTTPSILQSDANNREAEDSPSKEEDGSDNDEGDEKDDSEEDGEEDGSINGEDDSSGDGEKNGSREEEEDDRSDGEEDGSEDETASITTEMTDYELRHGGIWPLSDMWRTIGRGSGRRRESNRQVTPTPTTTYQHPNSVETPLRRFDRSLDGHPVFHEPADRRIALHGERGLGWRRSADGWMPPNYQDLQDPRDFELFLRNCLYGITVICQEEQARAQGRGQD
ncbi:hypothetical protein F5B21DRAFT_352162 [Xylaria acuta]|nr:hypothetical protein F5B21DRAFT_352162 [Xylaria acuta]